MDDKDLQNDDSTVKFASRSGLKLLAAIQSLNFDVNSMTCADFGCNVGGFTDCLLSRGASKVYAIDTGYGALAWKLRKDPRVVVMERTNALHAEVAEKVDLVVIDVAWTPQRLILPAAKNWLKSPTGKVITLVKPHYDAADKSKDKKRRKPKDHVLSPEKATEIFEQVKADCTSSGWTVEGELISPLIGGHGNIEYLLLLGQN